MCQKILDVAELRNRLDVLNQDKKRIALCDGYFNILHIGHIRYLKQAKSLSDAVVVSIFSDANLDLQRNKNGHYSEIDRAEALSELPYVDYVVINPFSSLVELAKVVKPDTLVAGPETNRNGARPYRLSEK